MIGIDLGSNTLRACKMKQNGELIWGFERIVGSARGMDESGLKSQAKERILKALKELKSEHELSGEYFGAATAAFRRAKNAPDFLAQIKNELGIELEIISGEKEASLVALGINSRLKALGISSKNALFIDLGGASTEISFKSELKSFDFGIVSFANDFGSDYDAASEVCASACEFISGFEPSVVVLSSGVPTTVAALKIGLNYASYDAKRINGMRLELGDFDAAEAKILASDDKDTLVGKARSDLLLCGTALMKCLLAKVSAPFVVVDDGLREGICFALFSGSLKAKQF